jgi:ABC-type methionine transport system permease subunit
VDESGIGGGSIGLGAAGSIVAAFGYNAAFLTLAAVAVIALLVMVVAMRETRPTPGSWISHSGVAPERDSHSDAGATHVN